jgi:peptidoglycan/xylan/chitin deacetylase (PgdA/CDA1 family)
MNLIRQAMRMMVSTVLPRERWLVRGSRWANSDQPALSLTFDDGPHPEHTPAVLDALAKWNLTATFFLVGREAERYPKLVERIVAAGHALGNHTYTHSEPRATLAEAFLQEVRQTDQVLTRWCDSPSHWVRPPKGELNWSKFRGLWQAHRGIALWNVDPRDYRMTTADQPLTWAKSYKPRHGDVILLHDRVAAAAQVVHALGEAWVFFNWKTVPLNHWVDGEQLARLASDSGPPASVSGETRPPAPTISEHAWALSTLVGRMLYSAVMPRTAETVMANGNESRSERPTSAPYPSLLKTGDRGSKPKK